MLPRLTRPSECPVYYWATVTQLFYWSCSEESLLDGDMAEGPIDRPVECRESFDQFGRDGGCVDPFADGDRDGRTARDAGVAMESQGGHAVSLSEEKEDEIASL